MRIGLKEILDKGIGPINPRKAALLLSGGLDSTLALRLMLDQGIDIIAVNFISPFCTCTPRNAGCRHIAGRIAHEHDVPILNLSKGKKYMRIVERPAFGRGRGMNPCIDCRIFMLLKVKELLPYLGASFVVTGEVLGQRPMSQHMSAINLIERESGLKDRLLRPLSARHFRPTKPEKEGIVDRERLLSIHGRSRKEQFRLAEEMNIELYSCPAGGCLLTDAVIARRLRDLFDHHPRYTMSDIKLLLSGRHFRIDDTLKVIVGRDEGENARLNRLAGRKYHKLEPVDIPGPLVIALGSLNGEGKQLLAHLLKRYTRVDDADSLHVSYRHEDHEEEFQVGGALSKDTIEEWRI